VSLRYEIVEGRERARQIWKPLSELFESCFGRPLDPKIWSRLYLENPYGEPTSSAAFDGDRMVGHHALIPGILEDGEGQSLPYRLFITLMTAPEYRGQGVFREVVTRGLSYSNEHPKIQAMLGFPNQNSHLPLQHVLQWKTEIETELMDWTPTNSENGPVPVVALKTWRLGSGFGPPDSEVFRRWRCQAGLYEGIELPGVRVLVKTYGNVMNILDLELLGPEAAGSLASFLQQRGLTGFTLCDRHAANLGLPSSELQSHGGYVLRLCSHIPSMEFGPEQLRVNLLLTDTF
jgi:Acetyltransferase (GNAT) domain